MDARVSPAVVVVVLVLVAAILVGLYFIVTAKPVGTDESAVVPVAGPGVLPATAAGTSAGATPAAADKPATDKPAATATPASPPKGEKTAQ